jgi:hypothetical protein
LATAWVKASASVKGWGLAKASAWDAASEKGSA